MKSNRSNEVHFRSNFRSLEDFFARDFFSVCAAYMVSADRGPLACAMHGAGPWRIVRLFARRGKG